MAYAAKQQKTPEEWFQHTHGCLPSEATPKIKEDEFERLKEVSAQRGWKPGAKFFRYHDTFGEVHPQTPPGIKKVIEQGPRAKTQTRDARLAKMQNLLSLGDDTTWDTVFASVETLVGAKEDLF